MNYLRTKATGIDRAIEQLQEPLYKVLKELNSKVEGYGRTFRNKRNEGFVLEALKGTEYTDVLNGEDSRFFFHLHNDLEGDTNVKARVDVVCMVKLTDFYSSNERQDEEFRALVAKTIQFSRFELKKTVIGMEYIESLVSRNYERANVRYSDMHPYHAVTFQTEVYYKHRP